MRNFYSYRSCLPWSQGYRRRRRSVGHRHRSIHSRYLHRSQPTLQKKTATNSSPFAEPLDIWRWQFQTCWSCFLSWNTLRACALYLFGSTAGSRCSLRCSFRSSGRGREPWRHWSLTWTCFPLWDPVASRYSRICSRIDDVIESLYSSRPVLQFPATVLHNDWLCFFNGRPLHCVSPTCMHKSICLQTRFHFINNNVNVKMSHHKAKLISPAVKNY